MFCGDQSKNTESQFSAYLGIHFDFLFTLMMLKVQHCKVTLPASEDVRGLLSLVVPHYMPKF